MRKITALLLSLTIAAFGLAGCAGGENGTSTTASPSQAASGTSGGEAADASGSSIVAYVGTAIFESSLNPIKGAMSYGYPFTNAALIQVAPSSEYVGDMATGWSVSEDALTYTFQLREGVKFSDGSDMTAEDVVFTYETAKEHQAENENVDLTRMAAVAALDEYQVQFTLSEPYSPFLDTTAMLGIVPSDAYNADAFEHAPVGAGPWKVVQYDANQQIIVEPNEHYYGDAPAISRVTLVYMDGDAALSAARSGQLDIVMINPDHATESVEGMTMLPLETMDIRQISLLVQPRQEQNGVVTGNDVTSDIAVRQALAIGIDREAIIRNAYNGIGKPAVGFTGNLIWADANSFEDNRRDEAAALLEGAGWVDSDGDGIREKDGIPCEFDLYSPADRYTLAAALAEDALALGIRISTHSASWDDISANANSAAVLWGWGQYSPTVIDSLFHSRHIGSGLYDNVIGYSNPEVDALIDSALSAITQEDAVANWKQAQAAAREDYPYLYIVNIEHCYFVSDRLDISVETQIPHPHGHGSPIICNMKDWTIK